MTLGYKILSFFLHKNVQKINEYLVKNKLESLCRKILQEDEAFNFDLFSALLHLIFSDMAKNDNKK